MSSDPVQPAASWLERNSVHVAAWVAGAAAVAMGFYDLEWGHQLAKELASGLLLGGLGAYGLSGAFAAGVKVPTPQ